jgi:hypothetical protein
MSWEKHPDPQLKRNRWFSLNGDWLLNGRSIKVPFCPESKASEFRGEIDYGKRDSLVYEKSFELPEYMLEGDKVRLILHADGVDQQCLAVLNGQVVGSHRDGYLKAVFDLTGKIKPEGENLLKIIALDPISRDFPYGKQKLKRGGMWYTPFSGIWKSVWLEAVPERYIKELKIDWAANSVRFKFNFCDFLGQPFEIRVYRPELKCAVQEEKDRDPEEDEECWIVAGTVTEDFEAEGILVPLEGLRSNLGNEFILKKWDIDEPWLYDMEITAGNDVIRTYYGFRTVETSTVDGKPVVLLNGRPVFLHGVLDQGYYEDSLCLPESEEEYERDILRMKEMGFNLLRKHVKTEADWFYYYCDIHGMLVMQDMVNSGKYRYIIDTVLPTIGLKLSDDRLRHVGEKQKKMFENHAQGVISQLHDHPSVIAYTIFNEGWGQHRGDSYYEKLKEQEPDRLFDTASGWFNIKKTDFDSRHIYFRLRDVKPSKRYKNKPIFITECGGYSMAVTGHLFDENKGYGYGKCNSVEELTSKIELLYENMVIPGIKNGVCGCIYTQVSDIEDEINGLYTYDREICKVDVTRMKELAKRIRSAMGGKELAD